MDRLTSDKIQLNAILFAIMTNFTPICGEDRAKEARDIVSKIFDRLTEYEDLEEQGLLIRLPCKAGDTIWAEGWKRGLCEAGIVKEVHLGHDNKTIYIAYCPSSPDNSFVRIADGLRHGVFSKTVFLTREEAEKALKECEGK